MICSNCKQEVSRLHYPPGEYNKKPLLECGLCSSCVNRITPKEKRRLPPGRLEIAAMAMQGLLSNPKLQPEILKHGGAFGGWIETSALDWADALIEAESK